MFSDALLYASPVLGVGGSHGEDITTVDPQTGPRQLETPHPFPVLRITFYPLFPQWELVSRTWP